MTPSGETPSMPLVKKIERPPSLERELLRKGVGDRTRAGRRCADCRRTPLVGERVHRYDDGRMRCELCRPLRHEEPIDSELVLGSEHDHAVRIIRAAA
jgi:hypothetical protein